MAVPAAGQPEQLAEPVEREQLELRRGGGGAPDERHLVEGGGEQLREDRRLGRGDGEVPEEARALPVGHRRQQDLVEIPEHGGERLALLRRRGRQCPSHLPWANLRQHRQLAHLLQVARRPLERSGAVFPEAAHARIRVSSAQGRVFTTWAAVSQARRACETARSR